MYMEARTASTTRWAARSRIDRSDFLQTLYILWHGRPTIRTETFCYRPMPINLKAKGFVTSC
jgi:hypothetical protein